MNNMIAESVELKHGFLLARECRDHDVTNRGCYTSASTGKISKLQRLQAPLRSKYHYPFTWILGGHPVFSSC
jgi:hypothetical protein